MYAALEIKETHEGVMTVDRYVKETRDEAERAYHSILSNAATSAYRTHSAMIINPEGKTLKSECYKHEQPEAEPEAEE
jgi:hypothetical protein